MKILLDECVTRRLKSYFPAHIVKTVTDQGWNGLKNGELMQKAVSEQFDLLLSIDKNIQFQHDIPKFDLIIVVLDTPTSNVKDIAPLIPRLNERMQGFQKGNAYLVSGN